MGSIPQINHCNHSIAIIKITWHQKNRPAAVVLGCALNFFPTLCHAVVLWVRWVPGVWGAVGFIFFW